MWRRRRRTARRAHEIAESERHRYEPLVVIPRRALCVLDGLCRLGLSAARLGGWARRKKRND
jgi:hypothetical protein